MAQVQLLIGDRLVDTQFVNDEVLGSKPSVRDLKRAALMASLEDGKLTAAECLQVTFRVLDVSGRLLV